MFIETEALSVLVSMLPISFDSSISFEVFPRPQLLPVVPNDNVDGVNDLRRLSGGGDVDLVCLRVSIARVRSRVQNMEHEATMRVCELPKRTS